VKMKSVVLFAMLLAGSLADMMLNNFDVSDSIAVNSIRKQSNIATNVNGNLVSFFNGDSNGELVLDESNKVVCTVSSCGVIYNHAKKTYYCPSLTEISTFSSITSGIGEDGKWHIYVGGQTGSGGITFNVGSKPVAVDASVYFILQLDSTFVLEKVISLTTLSAPQRLTIFAKRLVAIVNARGDTSISINGDEKVYQIDSSLITERRNVLVITDFGEENLNIIKVFGIATSSLASSEAAYIDVIPVTRSSSRIALSYSFASGSILTVNKEAQPALSYSQGFVFLITATSGASGCTLSFEKMINTEVIDVKSTSASFLDVRTIAVCHSITSDNFGECPKNSAVLAVHDVNGTLIRRRCAGKLHSYDTSSITAPYDEDYFIFASSFNEYLLTDGVELWRNSIVADGIDIPYIVIVRRDTLEFVEGRIVFNNTDPEEVYQPVGLVNSENSFTLLYSGAKEADTQFTSHRVGLSVEECENGVFDTTSGVCLCYNGETGNDTNPCEVYVSSSSVPVVSSSPSSSSIANSSSSSSSVASSTKSSSIAGSSTTSGSVTGSSSGQSHHSSTASKSSTSYSSGASIASSIPVTSLSSVPTPTPSSTAPVVAPSASEQSAEKSFLDSTACVVIFTITTVAFLAVTIVFVILFSKKRCGSSSSSGSVEMDS